MHGFLANASLDPNPIEEARQRRLASGAPLLDLTDANPTNHGILFPAEILREVAERYLSARCYKPDSRGDIQARTAIAEYYLSRGETIEPEWIYLTASTSESYSLLFSLLAEPGDRLLSPRITYPLFELLASHHRLSFCYYDLMEEHGWASEINDTSTAVAALLISPHNPTGAIQRTPIPALTSAKIPLICDEVFSEFYFSPQKVPPIGRLYPDNPVFHLNGISKMFALPDLKLGWIALNRASYERYGSRLEMLNDLFLSANSMSQMLVPDLFRHGADFVQSYRERVRGNISTLVEQLATIPGVAAHQPEGGTFVFPRIATCISEEELVIKLIERGIFLHPGYFYGAENNIHLMFSAIPDREKLESGVSALRQVLNGTD